MGNLCRWNFNYYVCNGDRPYQRYVLCFPSHRNKYGWFGSAILCVVCGYSCNDTWCANWCVGCWWCWSGNSVVECTCVYWRGNYYFVHGHLVGWSELQLVEWAVVLRGDRFG